LQCKFASTINIAGSMEKSSIFLWQYWKSEKIVH
jgi:hypothetical protein